MTLNDAVNKIKDEARLLGYSETSVIAMTVDLREMLYNVEDLTDEYIQDFVEECL